MSKLPEKVLDNGRCGYGDVFFNEELTIIIWDHDKIPEPHFHVIDTETLGKKFHCRILLRKAQYMKGETTKLSKEQINSLIKHLESRHERVNNIKRWYLLIEDWNRNNKSKAWYKKMPNYNKLN